MYIYQTKATRQTISHKFQSPKPVHLIVIVILLSIHDFPILYKIYPAFDF